jgi:hypothetical protein
LQLLFLQDVLFPGIHIFLLPLNCSTDFICHLKQEIEHTRTLLRCPLKISLSFFFTRKTSTFIKRKTPPELMLYNRNLQLLHLLNWKVFFCRISPKNATRNNLQTNRAISSLSTRTNYQNKLLPFINN